MIQIHTLVLDSVRKRAEYVRNSDVKTNERSLCVGKKRRLRVLKGEEA